ncbi:MAG: pteridine reductase [Pseudomonadales bacterium]|nr:pteridine reductase [Pseudomonadales bacterium]
MTQQNNNPVALITGGAKRIGAEICSTLHQRGFNIILHYRNAEEEAQQLSTSLNALRPKSCLVHQAALNKLEDIEGLAHYTTHAWGRVDLLVNNASSFYPTPVLQAQEADWDELMSSNLKGAFFLSQKLVPALQAQRGSIVNIIDVYAEHPLKNHPIYCIAKAGLRAMTQSLSLELGPDIRVNGVSPGAILWPESDIQNTPNALKQEQAQREIIQRTNLKRRGEPQDIAKTVAFLALDAPFISGQIIAVDGGRLTS